MYCGKKSGKDSQQKIHQISFPENILLSATRDLHVHTKQKCRSMSGIFITAATSYANRLSFSIKAYAE